ncbi:MAG: hypothetical protein JKX94_06830 [Sneathiella sp.]|nr:hypothetical protein [Sneathiella sp.]
MSTHPLRVEHHKHINANNKVFVPQIDIQSAREVIEQSTTLALKFVDIRWSNLSASKLWALLDESIETAFPESSKALKS